jgi:hypothetical protein
MKLLLENYKCLSWNTVMRAHWSKQDAMNKYAHISIREAILKEKYDTLKQYNKPVNIHIFAYLKRPIDSDNICDKLLIDGLKLNKIIVDDNPEYVVSTTTTSIKNKIDYTEIELSYA